MHNNTNKKKLISSSSIRNLSLTIIIISGLFLLSSYAYLLLIGLSFGEYNDEILPPQDDDDDNDDDVVHLEEETSETKNTIDTKNKKYNIRRDISSSSSSRTKEQQQQQQEPPQKEIAYVISLTACPKNNITSTLSDSASVLAHSIHLASQNSSSYQSYTLLALVHPTAEWCAHVLQQSGYTLLIRDIPVPLEEIRGDYLRESVRNNGCCGEIEFLKLRAYELVEYDVVVHLDLDVLILRPLDELFDAMLLLGGGGGGLDDKIPIMWKKKEEHHVKRKQIDAFFTRDYNMVRPGRPHVGVQGGFLVLRPSLQTYQSFVSIIREGNFVKGKGWGGLGYGPFYGSMTFQGIVPYYYDEVSTKEKSAVELDRCYYNQMADNPRDGRTINDMVSGKCRDGRTECLDCRTVPLDEVRTAHFTLCQKPWLCSPQDQDRIQERLCREFHGEWFKVRYDLWRVRVGGKEKDGDGGGGGGGEFQKEHFRGGCRRRGEKGYVPLPPPPSSSSSV